MCRNIYLLVGFTYLLLPLLISQLIEQLDMKAFSSLSADIDTHYQNKNTENK